METRAAIVELAGRLIKQRGFNAFSFSDLSKEIGIKTSSIHYHFPTKADLGVAAVRNHIEKFEEFKAGLKKESPQVKLESTLSIYSKLSADNKVCIIGSLATDLNTVEDTIKAELKILVEMMLNWLAEILQEGKELGVFNFYTASATKALMIFTNIMAMVQLSRLTKEASIEMVKESIIEDLKPKK
jgi:AcrR family transcriptional regulator